MKRIAVLIAMFAVVLVGQQAITGYIPVWSQGRYQFVTLDQLRAALDLDVPTQERIDFPILSSPVADFDVSGRVLQVYRNGLLQREGVDYSLTSKGIKFGPFPTATGDLITVIAEQ